MCSAFPIIYPQAKPLLAIKPKDHPVHQQPGFNVGASLADHYHLHESLPEIGKAWLMPIAALTYRHAV